MKISEKFKLSKTQFELDFVDINTDGDIPLFIESYLLSHIESEWAGAAFSTIRSFFEYFLALVKASNLDEASDLLNYLLVEPNETCLGLSKNKPKGKSLNKSDIRKIINSVLTSKALKTGIVEDLEDFRLFIKNIDKDKMSDMTTNIIRSHLIEYTIDQCNLWGIQLTSNVPTGFYWDSKNRKWNQTYSEMLVVDGKRILLTPKRIVTYSDQYTSEKYKQHFVLNFLQEDNITRKTHLVDYRKKSNEPFVTKKSIKENSPKIDKDYLINFTQNYPEVFEKFKKEIINRIKTINNNELTNDSLNEVLDYLKVELKNIVSAQQSGVCKMKSNKCWI